MAISDLTDLLRGMTPAPHGLSRRPHSDLSPERIRADAIARACRARLVAPLSRRRDAAGASGALSRG